MSRPPAGDGPSLADLRSSVGTLVSVLAEWAEEYVPSEDDSAVHEKVEGALRLLRQAQTKLLAAESIVATKKK